MIISSAGAEGISLTCVRQVHILEPFWNYVRIDQVLGRAIRMKSHEQLPKEERNVEQYLYLSTLPQGINLESVYRSLKNDPHQTWTIPDFEDSEIKTQCSKRENHEFKEILDSMNVKDSNMDLIDKSILYFALNEMIYGELDKPVIIDESLRLSKKFSSPESYKFINANLDKYLKLN